MRVTAGKVSFPTKKRTRKRWSFLCLNITLPGLDMKADLGQPLGDQPEEEATTVGGRAWRERRPGPLIPFLMHFITNLSGPHPTTGMPGIQDYKLV